MKKINSHIKAVFAALCVSLGLLHTQVLFATESDPAGVSKIPAPGVWCTDFEAVKKYSEDNDIPLVAFWGTTSCAFCDSMLKYGLKSDSFVQYQKERGIMLAYFHGGNKESTFKTWIKNSTGEWPYMAIYWKKGKVNVRFSGRTGKMIMSTGRASAGSTASSVISWTTKWIDLKDAGRIGDSKRENDEQLIAAIESYIHSWESKPAYSGGYFAVTNLPASRLEAELGVTTSVNIDIFRTATEAVSSNKLKINGTSTTISWAANQLKQTYSYTLPTSGLTAGDTIALQLLADDNTVMSVSAINVVAPKANSVKNPYWIGEKTAQTLGYGEWTMDLDVAKQKAKADGGRTLVLASGVLWCPFCKGVEEKILNKAAFADWAKENKVALVVLDNPKRSASDKRDANRNWVEVGTKADGAPPTLLRYAEYRGVSGAEYMSRKMISEADAEEILQRNHDLCYKNGALAAPEALCTGYPTFIMLDSEGKVVGRMLDGCDMSSYSWGLSVNETIARLDELMLLEGGEENSRPSTTTLRVAVEDETGGTLQVNDGVKFYRLTNVPAGTVTFKAGSDKITLSVYECDSTMTLAKATLLASGTSEVEVDFSSNVNKFLKVSSFENTLAEYGTGTTLEYTISSYVTLVPQLSKQEFTPISKQLGLIVEKGVVYKLTGFAEESLADYFETAADGTYVAKVDGKVSMDVAGVKVSYQIWNPGEVAFAVVSQRVLESTGGGEILLTRIGGSGVAAVDVQVQNLPERVALPVNLRISWKDGETGTKKIAFTIAGDSVYQPDEELKLTLVIAEDVTDNAAVIKTAAATHTVVITDTADPILDKTEYALRLYEDFDVYQVFPVYNIKENEDVSIEKIDGKLPSGIKLKYDSSKKALVLSGKASKTGSFEYRFAIEEGRKDGDARGFDTVMKFEVVNASELPKGDADYNAFIGKAAKVELPVYSIVEDTSLLVGTLSVSISKSNKITAKFDGARKKAVSFKGNWQEMDSGTAMAVLEKDEALLSLTLDKGGVLCADFENLDTDFGSDLHSLDAGVAVNTSSSVYKKYSGYYTVTLPLNAEALTPGAETIATGTGYLTLKMDKSSFTKSGKVSYAGMLADGTSVSGSAILLCDIFGDVGLLPVFKSKSKGTIGAALTVVPDAAKNYTLDPMVVLSEPGVSAYWLKDDEIFELDVFGGYYDSDMDMIGCCDEVYQTQEFLLAIDTSFFAPSERYGKLTELPKAKILVKASSFEEENENDLKFTVKFKKSTGIVSGKVPVRFEDGSKKSASYKGVLLPRWHDCGCTEVSVMERPFASGAAYYSDKVDGDSVKRGFAVDFVPAE